MTVVIALITAVVGPLALAWYTHRQLERRVGTPNGGGNLTGMVERLLDLSLKNDERLDGVERRLDGLERRQVL